jgi:hypothetical protein
MLIIPSVRAIVTLYDIHGREPRNQKGVEKGSYSG